MTDTKFWIMKQTYKYEKVYDVEVENEHVRTNTVQELIEILKDADPDATVFIKYSVEDSSEYSGYRDEFVALDEQ